MQSYEDYLKYVLGEKKIKIDNIYKENINMETEEKEINRNEVIYNEDNIWVEKKEEEYKNELNDNTLFTNQNNRAIQDNYIEKFYPDIYKKINPIINNIINENREKTDENTIEYLTNKVYSIIEKNGIINTYFRNEQRKGNLYMNYQMKLLKDMIKILIIKQLLKTK